MEGGECFHHLGNGYGPGLEEQISKGKASGELRDCFESEFVGIGDIRWDALLEGHRYYLLLLIVSVFTTVLHLL